MTCIVGFIDKGVTFLGGDSLASDSYNGNTILQKKVLKLRNSKNAIIGFSGSVRDLNLLQYAENLIDPRDEPNIDEKYLVTKFILNEISLFNTNGRNRIDKGINDNDSYFLLGYKDKLWKIDFNYAVSSVQRNYDAIGCGFEFALGSMYSTEGLSPVERIHKALQSASKFSVRCASPYYIINSENDEIIEFED